MSDIPWEEIEDLIIENHRARMAKELPDEWFPPEEFYVVNAPTERLSEFYRRKNL